MAIVIDQATIGSVCTDSSSTTQTFNTTATVASGGFIVVIAGCSDAGATCTISGGGLTWATDAGNAAGNVYVASAQAPSGLAINTTLTATYSISAFGRFMGGVSFTGVKSSAALDAIGTKQTPASGTAWTTGNVTIAAGSVLVASAEGFTTDGTSTTTGPAVEICDVNGGAGTENATGGYLISAAGGSQSVAGTWSTAQAANIIGAAYLAAPSAAVAPATADAVLYSEVSGPGADYGPLAFIEALGPIPAVTAQSFPQALSADVVAVTASMLKQVNKILTATSLAVTASMLRTVGKQMSSTAVAVTASIVKQVNKFLTATSVVVTASIATVKVKLLAMTATTVAVTASMLKQVNKLLTATTVAVTASMVRQINKALSATAVAVTATLSTVKVKLVAMTATTVAVTASMLRQVQTHLTAVSVALSASLVKQVNKRLTATAIAVTASMVTVKVKLLAMTATTIMVSASMVRRIAKTLSATSVVSAILTAVSSAISAFFSAEFDPSVGRGISGDDPQETDYTTDPHGNIRSKPHQGGFDS